MGRRERLSIVAGADLRLGAKTLKTPHLKTMAAGEFLSAKGGRNLKIFMLIWEIGQTA